MAGKNPREGAGSVGGWGLKDIEKLIDLLIEREVAEFEMEKDGLRIHIRRGGGGGPAATVIHPADAYPASLNHTPLAPPLPAPAPSPATPAESGAAAAETPSESGEGLHIIKSPIVGTFYSAASPNAPPFAKLGDVVQVGQVLCIIEAMKLMNEIESEVAGEVARIYVENGQPVEYGQPLFAIKPSHKK
jgi:acetyl-CoA carboxylase biotin carboxyl carrier protein